jgi:hypothetical protein
MFGKSTLRGAFFVGIFYRFVCVRLCKRAERVVFRNKNKLKPDFVG